MMRHRIQTALRRFEEDPFPWAVFLLLTRLSHQVKSMVLSVLFQAPKLYLGPRCVVRGLRHMQIGANFSAHGTLWLEAVATYQNQQFAPRIVIGPHVSVSEGVHITCIERIEIKGHVLVGSRVYISDHNHGIYKGDIQSSAFESPALRGLGGGGPVLIGENVWIGDNAILVGPLVIADGTVIGANSIVRHNTDPGTMVAGSPAKAIKRFNIRLGTWERV